MRDDSESGKSGSNPNDFDKVDLDREQLKSKALDFASSALAITDLDGQVIYANPAFYDLWQVEDREGLIGKQLTSLVKEGSRVDDVLKGAQEEGDWRGELKLSREGGRARELSIAASTIKEEDKPAAQMVSFNDITEIKEKSRTVQRQAEQLLEASTPIIEVWEGVLAAPLIGQLDTERTQRFMERLLQEIVDTESEIALIDITGVPDVDTRTAQHLIETVESVKLLGAQVVLTGVSPSIAQSVVHLGIDLSDITTRTSLAEGLEHVFKQETPWEIER